MKSRLLVWMMLAFLIPATARAQCASPGCAREIPVKVRTVFADDLSAPVLGRHIWVYQVTIQNRLEIPVQILGRRWRVVNGLGEINEIRGEGLVGERPVIAPNGIHRYESWINLPTASGMMGGSFQGVSAAGTTLEIVIPPFELRH